MPSQSLWGKGAKFAPRINTIRADPCLYSLPEAEKILYSDHFDVGIPRAAAQAQWERTDPLSAYSPGDVVAMSAILERPTLILNRNWQPIHVASVARALILVWNDAARVVDPSDFAQYDWADWSALPPAHGEPFIQAVSQRLRVPEVVTLTKFDRQPEGSVSFSRRNLFKRDQHQCQYCGCRPGGEELTIDHVVPRSRGGASTWENCVLACVDCNKRKADRSPADVGLKLMKKPVRPKWKPWYATQSLPVASWSKFISEAYWSVELEP